MPLHADTTSDEGKQALYDDLERASADLAQASVDVIAYACTAGSMVAPMTALSDFMTEVTEIPAVTTAAAIVGALRALEVRTIALATPYHDALNEHERDFLAEHQITTVALEGLGFGANGPEEYRCIARVPPQVAYRMAKTVDRPEAEAILISCTDFATLDVVPRLEDELGKPVISSNLATFWASLRAAGVADRLPGFGSLLTLH
jgi:maleate isomerase/arylmalonate decarboxylase